MFTACLRTVGTVVSQEYLLLFDTRVLVVKSYVDGYDIPANNQFWKYNKSEIVSF